MPVKPMLAAAAPTELAGLPYPLLASPKFDGVRATVQGGVVLSRSLKPLPNRFVQARYGRPEFEGLDGELIVGDPTDPQCYTRTTSGVMSLEGEPAVQFHVFDDLTQVEWPFLSRLASAQRRACKLPGCAQVEHVHLSGPDLLQAFEEACVAQGFEGIMLRVPHGIYKEGRSTVKEGLLLKVKRFQDSEAVVLGMTPLMHNANEATVNERGNLERSTKQAGKVARHLLGALTVRDLTTGVEFDIGTGFTQADREIYWAVRADLSGRIVKYKFQPAGVKAKPRFPVFLGFRDPIDL